MTFPQVLQTIMFLLCFSFVKLALPLVVRSYNPSFSGTEMLMIILFKALHMLLLWGFLGFVTKFGNPGNNKRCS